MCSDSEKDDPVVECGDRKYLVEDMVLIGGSLFFYQFRNYFN